MSFLGSANILAEFIIGMSRSPLCRKLFRTIFRTDSSPSSTIFPMQLSELMANRLERRGEMRRGGKSGNTNGEDVI